MNLKQALYIKTIAQTGSISKAAKLLYVSQPSLSQMLKQAEEEIGLKLFDRSKSPLAPTYAGERYLAAAEKMLNTEEQLEKELFAIRSEDYGRLRVGISVSRAIQILPDMLPQFREKYPNVEFELTECGSAALNEKLKSGEIDLAFATTVYDEPLLSYELLEVETLGVIAGRGAPITKKIAAGTMVSVEDLKGNVFVNLNKGHSARNVQDKMFEEAGFKPDVMLEANSLDLVRLLALKAGGCVILPNIYSNYIVEMMGGSYYPLRDCPEQRNFYACFRTADYMPKYTRDFINMVKEELVEVKAAFDPHSF